jgi:diguanylate cyclase (GGDEF)-like protein
MVTLEPGRGHPRQRLEARPVGEMKAMAPTEFKQADPDNGGEREVIDLTAHERDVAATARDNAADARDDASALLREEFAASRAATGHRVEAALERVEASLRSAAALARDEAAQARDIFTTGTRDDGLTSRAAQDRVSSAGDRVAAALDRQESASDRSTAAATLAQSYRDELTGALLRAPGQDQLGHAVERAHRGEPLVIAFVDIDRLKWFNDTHGHASGDHLLHQVGQALRHGLRSYDLVVRYGGDEFVCALPGAQLAEAEARFTDIARVLALKITDASITAGLTELTENQTLKQAIAAADRDMYSRRGK